MPSAHRLASLFVLIFAPLLLAATMTSVPVIRDNAARAAEPNNAAPVSVADPLRPPAIQAGSVPRVPAELAERLQQYQHVRGAAFRGWSPDGHGMLINTRFGDTAQLHRVYTPGGRREQITFAAEPTDGRFIPEARDGAVLLQRSTGGDENYQIYRLDRSNGKSIRLTDGKSRNLLGPIRHDGSRMIVSHNGRNGRDTDLYIVDPRQPEAPQLLLETDGEYWSARDWSRDGKTLLVSRYVSANESHPALLDVETGRKTPLPIPGNQPAAFGPMLLTPDGKSAYVATDARGEFQELARLDLKTLEYTWLSEKIAWDVESLEIEPHSGQLAVTVNEDGGSGLYLLENDTLRRVELPLGIVTSLEFSPDGKQLGFTLNRADAPADVYTLQLSDHALTRWTYSEVGGLNTATFVTPRRIQFKSFDERTIPAYYFQPRNASKERPVPVLIDIHGGPESQYRPFFSGVEQFYLSELGIAVIHPNVRGSDGYGKTYLKLDNAELREDSVRDIGALLDWIAEQPELDASRVAVSGGSYGGYMVLASLVHFGDRLRAGIDVVGIASFKTFLENTAAYRRDLRRVEYGDERDPKMQAVFARIDPLNNADRIRSALMVAHGKNDPRVPFSEAEQIADKVRANGRSVWTVYADNEGHGFGRKVNRDYLTAVTALFLEEHLRK